MIHNQAPFLTAGIAGPSDLDRLYRRFSGRVYSVGFRICRSHEQAEDVRQDTFLEIWRSRDQFSGAGPIGAWIHAIATSKALMLRRREQMRATWPLFDWDAPARTEPMELRVDLVTALERLDALSQQVTWLHDVEGWRHHEIAAVVGITETCSKARLRRARPRLRGYLG